MRFKIIILIVGVMAMCFGAQKAYVALTNTSPTKISCADFASGKATGTWIELTDCWIDYDKSFSIESKGLVKTTDKGTFLPVKPASNHAGPAALLIKISSADVDNRIIKTLANMKPVKGKLSPDNAIETISGMLLYGMDGLDSKLSRMLDKEVASGILSANYQVLHENAKPRTSDIFLGLAMLLVPPAIIVFWFIRSRKS